MENEDEDQDDENYQQHEYKDEEIQQNQEDDDNYENQDDIDGQYENQFEDRESQSAKPDSSEPKSATNKEFKKKFTDNIIGLDDSDTDPVSSKHQVMPNSTKAKADELKESTPPDDSPKYRDDEYFDDEEDYLDSKKVRDESEQDDEGNYEQVDVENSEESGPMRVEHEKSLKSKINIFLN